jgi:hypothetical protein
MLMPGIVRANPAGPAIISAFSAKLEKTWFDYESGRWAPPPPPPAPAPRKYHGYQ